MKPIMGLGIVWSSVALDWVMATSTRATMWALIENTLQGRGKFRRPLDKTCCCGVGSCLEDRFTTWHTSGSCFRLCFNSSVSKVFLYLFLAICGTLACTCPLYVFVDGCNMLWTDTKLQLVLLKEEVHF